MQKTAFVTGGSGFIGINLIEQLLVGGWEVTALCRPASDLTYLKRFPVRLVEGNLTDRASLEWGMPDSPDAVFHVAGMLGGINTIYYEFARQITQVMGARPPQKISGALLRTLGRCLGWIADLTGKPPVLTYDLADGMSRQQVRYSSEKARREPGFQDVPLSVCVRDCYYWMIAGKIL